MAIYQFIKHKVNLMRFIENQIVPSFVELELQLEFDEPTAEEVTETISGIDLFIKSILASGIMFKFNNETAHNYFFPNGEEIELGNIPISTPDEPTDEIVIKILYRKLNAILPDTASIELIRMHNFDDVETIMVYDGEFTEFPSAKTMAGPFSYYEEAWWDRKDFDTFDFAGHSEEDVIEFHKEMKEDESDKQLEQFEIEQVIDNVLQLKFGVTDDSQ